MQYFYDTSAIYEYFQKNPLAERFFVGVDKGAISLLVAMELFFVLLRRGEEEKAILALDRFFPLIEHPSKAMVVKSMNFRLKEQKRGLSYADALGYTYAKEQKMPFLTADSAFKGLPNVVFLQ